MSGRPGGRPGGRPRTDSNPLSCGRPESENLALDKTPVPNPIKNTTIRDKLTKSAVLRLSRMPVPYLSTIKLTDLIPTLSIENTTLEHGPFTGFLPQHG